MTPEDRTGVMVFALVFAALVLVLIVGVVAGAGTVGHAHP